MHSLSTSESAFAVHRNNVRQIFLSYYPSRLRTIFKAAGAERWVTLNKKTQLPDSQVIQAVSGAGDSFRGFRWADKTKFIVLDIDKDSQYHNKQSLRSLRALLSEIGLSGNNLYRSSMSNGWHLYIPLSEWVLSSEAAGTIKRQLKAAGYEIKCGQLEVFPSGAGLRLPLQSGFAWLDNDGSVVLEREELTADEAIGLFVHDIESNANDWNYTKLRIIEVQGEGVTSAQYAGNTEHASRLETDGFEQLFSNKIIHENYEKGRVYWSDGIQDRKDIHEAILCIGHYLWFGDAHLSIPAYPGSWNDRSRERLIRQWLENNHRGLSEHINSGDWEVIEENIERAVQWRGHVKPEREPYPITERVRERLIHLARRTGRLWHIDDLKHANESREKEARQKIKGAVHELLVEGSRVTGRAIAKITGCSRNTVKKHSDIWLQSGSGVYNLGVRGDLGRCSEEKIENPDLTKSESSEVKIVPVDSASPASFVQELAPEACPKELVPLVSSLDGAELARDEITIQREKKKLSGSNLEGGAETIQLVIDLADWVLKKREGWGPP